MAESEFGYDSGGPAGSERLQRAADIEWLVLLDGRVTELERSLAELHRLVSMALAFVQREQDRQANELLGMQRRVDE